MKHSVALLGQPGSSKSTCGLSYPGVEQQVFGSNEETTAEGMEDRSNIRSYRKWDWFECLTDAEKDEFIKAPPAADEMRHEQSLGLLAKRGRARNIIRFRRYLNQLRVLYTNGEKDLPETIFLDNGTPFSTEFQDYVELVYASEFETKTGEFNFIKFAMKYQEEMTDFFRMFVSLPCHTVASFHISMSVDEETSSRVNYLEDSKKGVRHPKEWQPLIMGKTKYTIAGIFDWAFFLWTEEAAGKRNKYFAKLEADSSNVGLAKGRIQPFDEPNKIPLAKGRFYQQLEEAFSKYKKEGK